jgi:hypothetical protein
MMHDNANDITIHGCPPFRVNKYGQVITADHCHCEAVGPFGHPVHDTVTDRLPDRRMMQGTETTVRGETLASGFADPTVETVLTFGPKLKSGRVYRRLGIDEKMPLVKRQDKHEDGSISTTFYLELTEDQYKALGGD